jgi:hypothetical protein
MFMALPGFWNVKSLTFSVFCLEEKERAVLFVDEMRMFLDSGVGVITS